MLVDEEIHEGLLLRLGRPLPYRTGDGFLVQDVRHHLRDLLCRQDAGEQLFDLLSRAEQAHPRRELFGELLDSGLELGCGDRAEPRGGTRNLLQLGTVEMLEKPARCGLAHGEEQRRHAVGAMQHPRRGYVGNDGGGSG